MPWHRSFAPFVREPEGNGVAERFIRTLKENLVWVKPFDRSKGCVRARRVRQALQQISLSHGTYRYKRQPGLFNANY